MKSLRLRIIQRMNRMNRMDTDTALMSVLLRRLRCVTRDNIKIGDKVPDFEVTIAGQTRKLSELQSDTAITADGTISLTF